jgi:hypothetical protein
MALPSPTSIGTVTFTWFAIDSNGKLGTSGEREVSVVDTSSPTIVDVLAGNMTVGAEPFVEARVEDLGGLSRVWVELTGVDGVLDEVEMAQQGMGLWRATLPVQSRGGELRYRVMARDGVGNVGASSNRTEVVRDQSPPVLRHTPPTELVEGQEALLAVNVTDDVGVVWVKLYLRLRPGSSYREVVLEQNASGDWVYTIPAGELESPEIRYYFEAEDMPPSSNVATMPPGAPALVLSATVKAAQLSISGVVLGRGGRPLSDATVIVAGQEVSSTSGTDGAYLLAGLNPGTYTIEVSAKGYKTLEFDVVLTALGGDRVQDVTLVPVLRDEGGEGSSMYLVVGILLLVATLVVFLLVLRRGRR